MARIKPEMLAGHKEIIQKVFEIRVLHAKALRDTDHQALANWLEQEKDRAAIRMNAAVAAAVHLPEPTRVLAMLRSVCTNLWLLARDVPRLLLTVGYPTIRRLLAGEIGSDPPVLHFVNYVVEETVAACHSKSKAGGWSRQVAFAYDNYMGRVMDNERRRRLENFALGLIEKGEGRYWMLMKSLARRMSNHLVIVRRNLLNGLARQGKIAYTHDRHGVVRCSHRLRKRWVIHNPEGLDRRDVLFFNDHFAVDVSGVAVLIDDVGPRVLVEFSDDPSRSTPVVGDTFACKNLGVIYRTSFRRNCCRLIKTPYSYLQFIAPFLFNRMDLSILFNVHTSDLDSVCALTDKNIGLSADQKYTNTIAESFNSKILSLFGFERDLAPYWLKFGPYSMQSKLSGRDSLSFLVRKRLTSELANGSLQIVFDEPKFRARHGSGTFLRIECKVPNSLEELLTGSNLRLIGSVRGKSFEATTTTEVLLVLAQQTGKDFQELSVITDLVGNIMRDREIASYKTLFDGQARRRCSQGHAIRDFMSWINYHTGRVQNSFLGVRWTPARSGGSGGSQSNMQQITLDSRISQMEGYAQQPNSKSSDVSQTLFVGGRARADELASYPVHPKECACEMCVKGVGED